MKQKKHLNFTALRRQLSEIFRGIPDWRDPVKKKLSLHDVLMSGFACMHFQDPSLLQFQERLKEERQRSNLQTLFDIKDIPKETQMREIIDEVDSHCFQPVLRAELFDP